MKQIFKHFLVAGIAACSPFFYSPSFAQSQYFFDDLRINQISLNYTTALESSNLGVAESALYHSVLFQKNFAGRIDERIQESVKKLYRTISNERIQHKAYLVDKLLSKPELLNELSDEDIKTEQDFYRNVATLLNEHYITTASAI